MADLTQLRGLVYERDKYTAGWATQDPMARDYVVHHDCAAATPHRTHAGVRDPDPDPWAGRGAPSEATMDLRGIGHGSGPGRALLLPFNPSDPAGHHFGGYGAGATHPWDATGSGDGKDFDDYMQFADGEGCGDGYLDHRWNCWTAQPLLQGTPGISRIPFAFVWRP